MARLHHVKKARKADKKAGIKKGDSYYWWQFRFGPKRKSKTRPRRSQLTQSEFYGAVYDLEDGIAEAAGTRDATEIASAAENGISTVEEIKCDLEDKQSNLSDAFPNGCPSLELIEERIQLCEDAISNLEELQSEAESYEEPQAKDDGNDEDEALEALIQLAEAFSFE